MNLTVHLSFTVHLYDTYVNTLICFSYVYMYIRKNITFLHAYVCMRGNNSCMSAFSLAIQVHACTYISMLLSIFIHKAQVLLLRCVGQLLYKNLIKMMITVANIPNAPSTPPSTAPGLDGLSNIRYFHNQNTNSMY